MPSAKAEAGLEQSVGRRELSPVVSRQKDRGNQDPPDEIAEGQLQKDQRAEIGNARKAQESERAGLGGHHGEHDRSPGELPVPEKVVGPTGLPPTEPRAPGRRGREVYDQDGQVPCFEADQAVTLFYLEVTRYGFSSRTVGYVIPSCSI